MLDLVEPCRSSWGLRAARLRAGRRHEELLLTFGAVTWVEVLVQAVPVEHGLKVILAAVRWLEVTFHYLREVLLARLLERLPAGPTLRRVRRNSYFAEAVVMPITSVCDERLTALPEEVPDVVGELWLARSFRVVDRLVVQNCVDENGVDFLVGHFLRVVPTTRGDHADAVPPGVLELLLEVR